MRLATFNLLHGRSLTDGLVDPDRLTAAVTDLDADVLALQEVDRDQTRSGRLDLTAVAARALHADHHRFAAAVVGTPGEQFRPLTHDDDGHGEPLYGIGLVSRYPVRSWQVTRLRPAPVRSPIYVPGPGGGLVLLRDEPRVVLAAVFINVLGIVSPIFVMNVYDRILPNKAVASLWVLAIGVSLAILFDLLLKTARAIGVGFGD